MSNPTRTARASTGPLQVPGVLANIVRDHVARAQEDSKERGTTRIDEAAYLVLLRDADKLDGMSGGE